MAVLSSKHVQEDKQTRDPSAITSLVLNHKALSDVSCLREFKNLERLDLSSNNLTSLEDLEACVNLKWLSVVQNKLQSLRGIKGLTKLTVLNGGKNVLASMDEVMPLTSLRALILNDNNIVSICKLDQMKELNTLVLSRNPISKIGESLAKVKSVMKVSLSNCQLQTIDSLKSCTNLKELRLAHNNIKTLPSELVHNSKLQLLDVGNNLITNWSDLKALSSLSNLKNLNIQGNPVAEKDKLAKKISKLVPNLHIFNAKLIDKRTKIEKGDTDERSDGSLGNVADKLGAEKEERVKKNITVADKKSKVTAVKENEVNVRDDLYNEFTNSHLQKELKRKRDKSSHVLKVEAANHRESIAVTDKDLKKKSKTVKHIDVSCIDDGEIPFTDLFADTGKNDNNGGSMGDKVVQDVKTPSSLNNFPVKQKRIKSRGKCSALPLSPVAEVGLGGPSTWGDD